MKKLNIALLTAVVMTLSSCDLAAGIFKAGMWTAVIGIVIVIALIFWIFSMFRK